MSVVPADVDEDRGPPMAVPLGHFVVAFGFLVAGSLVAVGLPDAYRLELTMVHLLLAGFVCTTILGATTQFVPVWTGTDLYSRRLAVLQVGLFASGVAGMAATFAAGAFTWLHAWGLLAVGGVAVFVYNVGRTLCRVDDHDVTTRHFGMALVAFALVATLGFLLSMDYVTPVFAGTGVTHVAAKGAHATLALYGAVVTTVFGALYQLATMFTQTELRRFEQVAQRVETVVFPLGVVVLATGRLLSAPDLARVGVVGVLAGPLLVGAVLVRLLLRARVAWTPMLSRYAVVGASLLAWPVVAGAGLWAHPLGYGRLFGARGGAFVLGVGVVGFVVLGTLYHVVPFIVWVHRYSDLLGFEPVPSIDDLYDDRVATADFVCLLGGGGLAVLTAATDVPGWVPAVGAGLVALGVLLFVANLLSVVRTHSPYSLSTLFRSMVGGSRRDGERTEERAD